MTHLSTYARLYVLKEKNTMARVKCTYELSNYLNIFITRKDSNSYKPLNVKSVTLDGKLAELRAFYVDYDEAESKLNIDGDIFRVDWDNRTGEFSIDRETGIVTIYFKVAGRHLAISSDYAEALYYYYDTNQLVLDFLYTMEDAGVEFTDNITNIAGEFSYKINSSKKGAWGSDLVLEYKNELIDIYRYCISKVDELCDEELINYI